jgi:hypothetical protein
MPVGSQAGAAAPNSISLERVVQRMIRAIRLERGVYEEVQFDPAATRDALVCVIIVSVATGLGQFIASPRIGPQVFVYQVIGSLVLWYLWSYLTYFVGVKVFGGRATAVQVLRTMGFAYAPGVLGILVAIPGLNQLVVLVVFVWDVVTGVVAVRTALDFDTGKAVLTVLTAALVAFLAVFLVGALLVTALR